MNGIDFFNFLRQHYQQGIYLYNTYSFIQWIAKADGTFSFQFTNNPPKAIPQQWIIAAKNDMNNGIAIDRDWFMQFGENANDCRASILMWLLNNH
jgi:hypothetical protein